MAKYTVRPALQEADRTAEQEDWLGRVDKIAPIIEEHRETAERERRTPRPVFDALREAGLTRMWVSRSFGGAQASIEVGSAAVQALARLDASVAWQVGVQGAIGRLSDYLSEEVAAELFEEHAGLVVGGVNPAGRAEPVEGGFRVEGTWSFASGSAHADWLVCAAPVFQDGERVEGPGGPEMRMCFFPAREAEMLDTWHTAGLRGTGSENFSLHGLFVPERYTVRYLDMLRAPRERPSRAYPIGYYDFGPFTSASTALGVARAAVEHVRDLALGKVPAASGATVAASHTAQEKFARASSLVLSSTALLQNAARQAVDFGTSGGDDLSALVRLTAATVAEQSVAAVDLAYVLAGSSSLFQASPLDRCMRDVRGATKHITLSSSHFETVGQYLLGGPLVMRR
jgi:alkylation response protein AidB-like acyl-CoA dehydrogenase